MFTPAPAFTRISTTAVWPLKAAAHSGVCNIREVSPSILQHLPLQSALQWQLMANHYSLLIFKSEHYPVCYQLDHMNICSDHIWILYIVIINHYNTVAKGKDCDHSFFSKCKHKSKVYCICCLLIEMIMDGSHIHNCTSPMRVYWFPPLPNYTSALIVYTTCITGWGGGVGGGKDYLPSFWY